MDTSRKSKATLRPTRATDSRPMCSCGLSRTFPFCDGSQMIAKTNHAGVLVSCGVAKTPKLAETEA